MALFLVTGGAGFIGSHLVDALLSGGHSVRVLDDLSTGRESNLDPRAELVVGDAADPETARGAVRGASGVFHLAAVASVTRSNEDWNGTHRANQSATVAVLDAARDEGRIPVVYASSAAIYGPGSDGPIGEDTPARPLTAYGADKLGSELHAKVAWNVHGVPTLGLRFFNVYGPRQDPGSPYSGVISVFVDRARLGKPVRLDGDGQQVRDFVYVADIVRFLMAAMGSLASAPRAAVLNACTGRATTLTELLDAVRAATGREIEVARAPARVGDIRVSLGNPDRTAIELGLSAGTALQDGLAALVSWRP